MNVLIVDTSCWISYLEGEQSRDLDNALKEGRVFLPPVVIAELLSGKLSRKKRDQLSSFLVELPLCDSGFEHWSMVGELRCKMAKKGIQISTPDAHIAQCAMDLDGYLMSSDKIFLQLIGKTALRMIDF